MKIKNMNKTVKKSAQKGMNSNVRMYKSGGPTSIPREKSKTSTRILKRKSIVKKKLSIISNKNLEEEENPIFTKTEMALLEEANQTLPNICSIQKLQRNPRFFPIIKSDTDLAKYKNTWININLMWITEFMGDFGVWYYMIPIVKIIKSGYQRGTTTGEPRAFFIRGHWTCIKANSPVVFDPYDEYQIRGTNQFCQTYTMMYLLDKLPQPPESTSTPISKYYYYTRKAIEFIIDIIDIYPFDGGDSNTSEEDREYYRRYHLNRARNCLEFSNFCLNSIELDINTL